MRSWKLNLVTVLVLVGAALAAPSDSRDETQNSLDDLNPVNAEDGNQLEGLDREKRKLPEAVFGTKNAVLGFVFSKIDNAIDAKTRFVDALDKTNIAKNKQYGIEVPKPIGSFQDLIQAAIAPKIQAVTLKFGQLGGLFGASSGGGGGDGSGASAGLGSVLGSLLKLSGPILSSSAGVQTSSTDDFDADDDVDI